MEGESKNRDEVEMVPASGLIGLGNIFFFFLKKKKKKKKKKIYGGI